MQVNIYPDDVLLGFLPLAHVFELLAESVCLLTGVPIGYSSANTLIDSSTKIMKGSRGDASVLQPTCITAVPLILDRICKGIADKVNRGSSMQKAMFKFFYDYKAYWYRRGYKTPILNSLVFKKITKLMGGNLRLMISGGELWLFGFKRIYQKQGQDTSNCLPLGKNRKCPALDRKQKF